MKTMCAALVLLSFLATPVMAAGPQYSQASDIQRCADPKSTGDVRVASCLAALKGDTLPRNQVGLTFSELGAGYLQEKDFEHAIPAFNTAINYEPKLWQVYMNRATAFVGIKQFDHAMEDFNQVIALNPKSYHAYFERGTVYAEQKHYDLAIADFTQTLVLSPDFYGALVDRGAVYDSLGKTDEAIADYTQAIRVKPNASQAFAGRAFAYGRLEQYAKEVEDWNQALALQPGNPFMLNSRCFARAVLGTDLSLALDDCDASLKAKPDYALTQDSRAFVEFRMSKFADAIADDTAALTTMPKLAPSLYIRGLSKRKSGDTAGGNADIAAAKAIDPKIADTYAGYGVTP